MKIVVLGTKDQLAELSPDILSTVHVETAEELLAHTDADGYFDLLFENTSGRIQLLAQLLPKPIFINSVIHPLSQINNPFIRINGWPTFLKRPIIEASIHGRDKGEAEKIAIVLNKTIDWMPDVPGLISPRVISMIINEAYFALEEKVSAKQEIDVAMRLGTNYPYGPFEWSEKIGLKNIYALLDKLSETNSRYKPAALLTKEANQ